MLAKEREKFRMANHIQHLFALRAETFRPTSWDCVLRDEQLTVIRPYAKEPTDRVIMHRFIESGRSPSLPSTYLAVRRNWQILAKANIEEPVIRNVDSPFLGENDFWWYRNE